VKVFMPWRRSDAFLKGFWSVRRGKDEFVDHFKNAEVLLCGHFKEQFLKAPHLKHIHSLIKSTGRIERVVNKASLEERGITLTHTFGTHGRACAEYLLWVITGLERNFFPLLNNTEPISHNPWSRSPRGEWVLVGGEGEIGIETVHLLKSAYPDIGIALYDKRDTKAALFHRIAQRRVIGVVSLLPLNPDTHHFFDFSFFKQLHALKQHKKTPLPFFIDISRGNVTNPWALYWALKHGVVGRAFMDVFEKEPATHSPAFQKLSEFRDRFFITPHVAGVSKEEEYLSGVVAGELINDLESGTLQQERFIRVKIPHIEVVVGYVKDC